MKHTWLWMVISGIRFVFVRLRYFKAFGLWDIGLVGRQPRIFLGYKNTYTKIGNRFKVFGYNEVFNKGHLEIGRNMSMNHFSRIVCMHKIVLGDNVNIAEHVAILDHDHDYKLVDGKFVMDGYVTKPIIIGNDVWIGDKATILKGVTIGDNVTIGAHSLVNKDIPSNCIAGGIPCKVIRHLA